MGASGWDYVVPYQEDLAAALDVLRRQVFADGDYLEPGDHWDLPTPKTIEELWSETYSEYMGNSGTHSIIDVWKISPADQHGQDFGTIKPLTPDETLELFGVDQPSRQDYERVSGPENSFRNHDYADERWTGRSAVLWAAGEPTELAFWGFSGD